MQRIFLVLISTLLLLTGACRESFAEDNKIDLSAAINALDITKLDPLSQEHQEMMFFKRVCVDNKSDEEKIRDYFNQFKDATFDAGGKVGKIVWEYRPELLANFKFIDPTDAAVSAWHYNNISVGGGSHNDPGTYPMEDVAISKQHNCQFIITNTLNEETMSKEFKGLVYAMATLMHGNLHGGISSKPDHQTGQTPQQMGLLIEEYIITVPGNPLAIHLVMAMSESAKRKSMLLYGVVKAPPEDSN